MSRRPEIELPKDCYCPISHQLMKNPVMAADGHTYDFDSITQWLQENNTSPLTNKILPNKNLTRNHTVRNLIDTFFIETKRRELAEERLAQAEGHLKNVLTDLSNDESATVPVTIEAVINSFHGVGLFAPPPQLFDPVELQELLKHIASGDQEGKAEGMIQENRELLKHAVPIMDHADRELTLTPFQLALFYRDWHMWQMIRSYMDPADAATQLQALEKNGTPYGTHYDFSDLKNAYQAYLNHHKELVQAKSWDELNRLFVDIGKAQARAPLNVLQEHFRLDCSFAPTQKFDETEGPLPRAMKLLSGQAFRAPRESIEGKLLGVHFAFVRHKFGVCHGLSPISRVSFDPVAAASLAVAKLCETRSMQYQNLKVELLQNHVALQSS